MKLYAKLTIVLLAGVISFLSGCSPTEQYLRKRNIKLAEELKDVRVLLLKTKDTVTISCESKVRGKEIKSERVVLDKSNVSLKFRPDNVENSIILESWDQPIAVNNMQYRGLIEIHNSLGVLQVINVVSMNDYLKGVVPSEIPALWPEEALKAQAVAARTFCYYHIAKGNSNALYNLDASTNSQVYKGVSVEKPTTTKAVEETAGIIITEGGQPIIAYFHSTCGGRTADDQTVWSGDGHDYLKGITCKFCGDSPHSTWESELSLADITKTLQTKYNSIDKITNISFAKKDGRVVEVKITYSNGSVRLKGNDFRLMFPSQTIKSLYFTSEKKGKGLLLKGHGWGHGVGMCQWGAKGMADAGFAYKNIISHYYKNIRLVKISLGSNKLTANNSLN